MNTEHPAGFERTLRYALTTEMLMRLRPTMVHGLKGPTQTILSALHMLVKSIDAPITADTAANRARYVEWIRGAVSSLNAMAEKVVPQELEGSGEPQPCDLGTLTDETVRLLRDEAALRSIEFEVEKAEPLPPVHAKHHELKLVLQTLLSGVLDRAPGEAVLKISLTHTADALEWSIAIPGRPGTAKPDGQAFELSFDVEPPRSGIGWYVARAIIAEHNGSVALEDRGGDGWLLKFRLPV